MTDDRVAAEVVAIKDRLAALAADPKAPGVAEELGAIRAQLRSLAESNQEVGRQLAESLGLRLPR